jgi:exonuclease III
MRVVTWNCRRATQKSPAWKHLQMWAPDIALLQEVRSFPGTLADEYNSCFKRATGKWGTLQAFGSALMVRGKILDSLPLQSKFDWVNSELSRFSGNIFGKEVELSSGTRFRVINVYSPAWPVNASRLVGIDTSGVKLSLNRNVWVADLLWSALKEMALDDGISTIIGGDFNLSETFDAWRGGPRGNREYLDRMSQLGLTECLREVKGALTPTFKNPRGGAMIHQIDHLFVNSHLATHLQSCITGEPKLISENSLSDHLPIIADFTDS